MSDKIIDQYLFEKPVKYDFTATDGFIVSSGDGTLSKAVLPIAGVDSNYIESTLSWMSNRSYPVNGIEWSSGTTASPIVSDKSTLRFHSHIASPFINEAARWQWTCAYEFTSFIEQGHHRTFVNAAFEMHDKCPNYGDHINLGVYCTARTNRNASLSTAPGSGGDMWGLYSVVNNDGYIANGISIEICNTNRDVTTGNYMDTGTEAQPPHMMMGLQIYPDGSLRHVTRAVNILGIDNTIGWDTGICCSGYVRTGIYLNTTITDANPGGTFTPNNATGIRFGSGSTKIGIDFSAAPFTGGYAMKFSPTQTITDGINSCTLAKLIQVVNAH